MNRQSILRIEETLIEHILSYLTFEEKVMFECLSKRVQSLIYKKQTKLSLCNEDPINLLEGLKIQITVTDFATAVANDWHGKCVDKEKLASLLKKCPNIESIDIDCYINLKDLMIIGHHCPNLNTMRIDTMGLSVDELVKFSQNYGYGLKKIALYCRDIPGVDNWWQFLEFCPNLTHLWCSNVAQVISWPELEYLPKVKSVGLYSLLKESYPDFNNQLIYFDIFARKYEQTLKEFQIEVTFNLEERQIDQFFASLAKLCDLEEMAIAFHPNTSEAIDQHIDHYFSTKFGEVANHWRKVKKLCLDTFNNIDCDHFLTAFQSFRSLRQLVIRFEENVASNIDNSSVQCFRNNKFLKKLFIRCKGITEEFFNNIDVYLPKLREIEIHCESGISNKPLLDISNLKKLVKLSLKESQPVNYSITDLGVCALITGCPDWQLIRFSSQPFISSKSIEALITCANNNPKKILRFLCLFTDLNQDDEDVIPVIDINQFNLSIPSNLYIDLNANQWN